MNMHERYLHDPLIRNLVDTLESIMSKLQMTPTEVRECAMLACVHHEEHKIRQQYRDRLTGNKQ